jgi:hypothetical protein
MVAIAVMFNLVWWYASNRGRLLVPGIDAATIAATNRSYLLGPIVYGAAALIAPLNAFVSLSIYAALAVYWLLPGTGPRATGLSPVDEGPPEDA